MTRQSSSCLLAALCLLLVMNQAQSFHVTFMAKRAKGNLKRALDEDSSSSSRVPNKGLGQEITGVSLPADGAIKGWEFGEKKTMVCANLNGKFYALEGQCPRCAFDLYRGDLISNDPGWEDLPRVACPTCATTYSLSSGKYGPPLKRSGLAGFVSNLTKQATNGAKPMDAEAFQITVDDDGRVYCRKKQANRR